ncbi:MAG: OadG family protein [Pseudomonadales bacterium]|uniref:Probable oxaloacetate decarboxylase gamma chain n=1 Tax=Oleiphilus messinensis TaxID=141451 RepID=A0A1Y0IDZ1_9GAMM|nr:OadG family protein [Oleiphilus messinensis]ARU57603.1 sodium pump decarboxylase subunit gamma [Oleiphilus messinensis]MCG8609301.1 OadG family protein [Pseudomonadales bacterium]
MSNLMSQAFELMIVGMGFVFVFLVILIFATTAMSKVAAKLTPPAPQLPATPKQTASPADDAQLLAVISAAVQKYRSHHKK